MSRSLRTWTLALLAGFGIAGAAHAADPATGGQKAKPKPYTLKVCVVSDEKLGSMGETKTIVHEDREIKFCCAGCEKDFKKDPAKYVKKIEEGEKKK